MGILNRLWQKVWDSEKQDVWRMCENEVTITTQAIREKWANFKTEKMKACEVMGGPEQHRDIGYDDLFASQLFGASTANVAMQQAAYLQQIKAQQAQAATNTASALAGSAIHTGLQPGGISGTLTSTSASQRLTSQTINRPRWPLLGDTDRDVFFMALKGIEEAALKKPAGNHDYDDLAYAIQDLRKFNPKEVSLLGVVSFCVSNMMDPNGAILLLEGHGMVLV